MTVAYDAKRCSFCASPIKKAVHCPSCSCERYCSTWCLSAAKKSYHEELCKRGELVQALFDSMQSDSDLTETCQAFYAIKLIAAILQQSNARGVSRSECCKELDMLCAWRDHDPDRLKGYACSYSSLRDQFRHASRVMGVQDDPYFDFEWFDRVGQSVSCNMIGITGMAVVLMNLGSMVNHSCNPNCQVPPPACTSVSKDPHPGNVSMCQGSGFGNVSMCQGLGFSNVSMCQGSGFGNVSMWHPHPGNVSI